jgi:hypothetical protein
MLPVPLFLVMLRLYGIKNMGKNEDNDLLVWFVYRNGFRFI